MSGVKRTVLRYHGGKWMLAPWIISHFPEHRIYVEPFGGGAAILMRKKRSHAEVYNDLSASIVNVFRVLRDRPEALRDAVSLTPFSRDEFIDTYGPEPGDSVEWARRTIFRSMAGFGSSAATKGYKTGFRSNSSRSGTTPARDWMHYPDRIASFAERLRGVVIENRDYREVMEHHDGPETLHYCDPPYVHSTRRKGNPYNRCYEHEMTDDDHREFARFIRGLQGMVIVSGYDCDLYRELFGDWRSENRSAFADGAQPRQERLWFSPNAPAVQHALFAE